MSRYIASCFLSFLIALPVAGCGGDDGGEAALVSAFPDTGFAGRTTTLILVGENTNFTASSQVDFGAGVTVGAVMPAGGTGLIVEVTAASDAELGPRTVTVDGLALADAFTIASPIEVEVLGTPAQGSFSLIRVTNLDLANPFDLTTDPESGEFLNLAATVSTNGSAFVSTADAFSLELVLQLDVGAATGPASVELTSGTLVSRTSVDVQATTPMPITAGGPVTGSVANGFDSVLYELNAEDLTAVLAGVPQTETGAAFIQVLGSSGSFDEPVGAAFNSFFGPVDFSNNVAAGEKIYLILWAGIDAAGFEYTFDVDLLAAPTTITHAEPNDTDQQAQAIGAGLAGVLDASFTSATDEDWYAIDVAEADVGKAITVVTGGASSADPVVEIFAPDATTSLGGPEDAAFFDRLTSAPTTTAGTHFVRITSSDFGPTIPDDSAHTIVIALE